MKIGVVTGMKEELVGLQRPMSILPQNVPFYCFHGKAGTHKLTGAWVGCGKVAAAMCATMLIERYGVDLLVISGTAGLLSPRTADTFAVSVALQHDYGSESIEEFELYKPGHVPIPSMDLMQDFHFTADPFLVETVLKVGAEAGLSVDMARIATGDIFAADPKLAETIQDQTMCALIDMETAAVAQVAELYRVPWVGIKAASDGASAAEFQQNLEAAARRSTVLTERLIEAL